MSACGSPPGTGLGTSIFPTTAIYTTLDVSYVTLQNECLPSLVIYYDYSGVEITRVVLTYTDDLDPIWLGKTLKDHRFNIQQAAFELVTSPTTLQIAATDDARECNELEIIEQLKKINMYFSLITGNKL